MTEEELLAGVCMDDLPDQSLADMTAANAKIPVSVKDQGSYNIALAAVLESSKTDAQAAVAAHVAAVDPHAQYVRGTEIGETLCPLEGGVIPSRFFPASYDEVQYFNSLEDFPSIGVDNVIYVSRDDNISRRWGGEKYHPLNAALALGETADTAYPGNRGKVAYDHALAEGNPHRTTPADIGLGNVDNTNDLDKPVSTATSSAISTASTADRNRANHTGTQAASTISDFAATVRSTVLTGLATGTNVAIAATDTVLGGLAKLQAQIAASLSTLNSHTGRTDNPHSVTKAQVGLGNVDNTKDLDKPVSTAMANALAGKEGAWGRGGISQSTDWNTVIGLGIYKVETTAFGPNGPTLPVNTWGVLTVIGFNNSLVQIYVPQADPGSAFSQWCWRTYYDGVWCTWNSSYNSAYINSLFAGKQGLLTFDNAPTANSANPVTSNGLYNTLLGKVDKVAIGGVYNYGSVGEARWRGIAVIDTVGEYNGGVFHVVTSSRGGQADIYIRCEGGYSTIECSDFTVVWSGIFAPIFKVILSGYKAIIYMNEYGWWQTSIMRMEVSNNSSCTISHYIYNSVADPGTGISPNYIQRSKLAFASTLTSDAQAQLNARARTFSYKASSIDGINLWTLIASFSHSANTTYNFGISLSQAGNDFPWNTAPFDLYVTYRDGAFDVRGYFTTDRAAGDIYYGVVGGVVKVFLRNWSNWVTAYGGTILFDSHGVVNFASSTTTTPTGMTVYTPLERPVPSIIGDGGTLPADAPIGKTAFVDGSQVGYSGAVVNAPSGDVICRVGAPGGVSSSAIGAYRGCWFVKTTSSRWVAVGAL